VLATPKACESSAVEEEIRTFLTTGRTIVPVDLCGDRFRASFGTLLAGLAFSTEPHAIDAGEGLDRAGLIPQAPSGAVISRIVDSITFQTRNRRLRRAASTAIVVLIISVAGASGAFWLAQDSTAKARAAQTQTIQADALRREAEKRLQSAQTQTERAISDQHNAERLQHRADLLTRARIALTADEPLRSARLTLQGLEIADGSDGRLLFAEASNEGLPFELPKFFADVRELHVDPANPDRLLVIGDGNLGDEMKSSLAIIDIPTHSIRSVSNYRFLAAAFSANDKRIYAVAVTRYERGPDEGMDTKAALINKRNIYLTLG